MFRFKNKFRFSVQAAPDIANYLLQSEEIIRLRFIPSITGGHIYADVERALLALPRN